MRGRMLLVTVLAALMSAAPARAQGDPVMALADVQPGMRCTGYSVFKGTAVESFDVEVLDVVGSATTGESQPRILVRVSGPRVDATGIGPGFSGSPIYCPGADGLPRNAGAISETIGDYGGKVVLATPIEQVLASTAQAPGPATRRSKDPAGRRARGTGSRAPSQARSRSRRDAHGAGAGAALLRRARPLASPITVRGLDRNVFAALSDAARRRGVALLQAPPAPMAAPPSAPLVPGSAIGVGISSGDIAIGGIGTVTYVDGDRVWAFGHSFDGAGARALLLQDAYVATIVNNPVQLADSGGTYKLAGPTRDIGTLTDDGFDGVAGRVGALPPTIPVDVHAQDVDRGRRRDVSVRVADETDVGNPTGTSGLTFAAPLAIVQAATDALGASPLRVAGDMCLRVTVREMKDPLRFCNRYVSDGTVSSSDGSVGNLVGMSAANDAAGALSLLDAYKGEGLHVTRVSAKLSLTRQQRQAYLRRLILPRRVRAGSDVRAKLVVKLVRGDERTIRFRYRVPYRLRSGEHRFRIVGADPDSADDPFGTITIDLGEADEEEDTEGLRTNAELAAAFKSFARYDGLHVRGLARRVYRDPTLRIGGRAETTAIVRHPRRSR